MVPFAETGRSSRSLKAYSRAQGWNVVKVLWGSGWDGLFARDAGHALLRRFAATVDGKYQTLGAKDGAYNLSHFFGEDPEGRSSCRAYVWSATSTRSNGARPRLPKALLQRSRWPSATKGKPTVILAKTKKGYGMGGAGESRMTAHQAKKLDVDALIAFRDRFALPLTNDQVERLEFFRPAEDSAEISYMRARREALGGFLPARRCSAPAVLTPPAFNLRRIRSGKLTARKCRRPWRSCGYSEIS